MALQSHPDGRTINELQLMFRNRQINLEPGFQRQSVWSWKDRRRLIQSIISNYPIPSIFLYKRYSRGKPIYDVIDGKQRLESILMFTRQGRFKREWFDLRLDLGDGLEWVNWKDICRHHHQERGQMESYKIQTVEVTGDFGEIVDLFVRINSTGKPLTSGEKRHARFYKNAVLKEAERLVGRYRRYFVGERILSESQLSRMKGTELVSELLVSLFHGGIINKKTALDRAIGNESIDGRTLNRIVREFKATLSVIRKVLPNIRSTRFHNVADFYSLFVVFWEMRGSNCVFNDHKRNRMAEAILRRLSTGVDELRDQLRRVAPAKVSQKLYSDYLLTVQGDTDSSANRQRRSELLRGLLVSLFERKDDKRFFSPEQRRILWNTDQERRCAGRWCHHARLSWDNFAVDHRFAHSRGGKTSLKNAQLMCKKCNSKKGAR